MAFIGPVVSAAAPESLDILSVKPLNKRNASRECQNICNLFGTDWNKQWIGQKDIPYYCRCDNGFKRAIIGTKNNIPYNKDNVRSVCAESCGFFNARETEGDDNIQGEIYGSFCGCVKK